MFLALYICSVWTPIGGVSYAFIAGCISARKGKVVLAIAYLTHEHLVFVYKAWTNKGLNQDIVLTGGQNIALMGLVFPMNANLGPCPDASLKC